MGDESGDRSHATALRRRDPRRAPRRRCRNAGTTAGSGCPTLRASGRSRPRVRDRFRAPAGRARPPPPRSPGSGAGPADRRHGERLPGRPRVAHAARRRPGAAARPPSALGPSRCVPAPSRPALGARLAHPRDGAGAPSASRPRWAAGTASWLAPAGTAAPPAGPVAHAAPGRCRRPTCRSGRRVPTDGPSPERPPPDRAGPERRRVHRLDLRVAARPGPPRWPDAGPAAAAPGRAGRATPPTAGAAAARGRTRRPARPRARASGPEGPRRPGHGCLGSLPRRRGRRRRGHRRFRHVGPSGSARRGSGRRPRRPSGRRGRPCRPRPRRRRAGRGSDSLPAQAWAGVVAQWLAGAVVGAALWVLFRYLWGSCASWPPRRRFSSLRVVIGGASPAARPEPAHHLARRAGRASCSPRRRWSWYCWGDEVAAADRPSRCPPRRSSRVGPRGLRVRRRTRLRRRRADGVDRPASARTSAAVGAPGRGVRGAGARRARALPAVTQRVWSRRPDRAAAPRRGRGRRSSARRRSWCTRRSAGSAATPPAFGDEIAPREQRRGVRAGGGEHVPAAPGPGPAPRPYAPGHDPTEVGYRALHARPLAHRGRRRRRARAARPHGRRGWRTCTSRTAAATRATSTWCPAAARSRAPRCAGGSARPGSTARSSSRSAPAAAGPATSARRCWPSRCCSPGCTCGHADLPDARPVLPREDAAWRRPRAARWREVRLGRWSGRAAPTCRAVRASTASYRVAMTVAVLGAARSARRCWPGCWRRVVPAAV